MHETDILFDTKELYLTQFDGGINAANANIPSRGEKLFPGENIHWIKDLTYDSASGFPELMAYNGPIDYEFVSYKRRRKYDGTHHAIHFFLYDREFKTLWDKMDTRTRELADYQLLLTPDYTLAVDVPDFCNKIHLFKSRCIGAYWQKCGLNVLPTATWGNVDSFDYCFSGLPENSIIAVCGVGHKRTPAHTELWKMGLRELECQKHPTKILVYGEQETVEGLQTPLSFVPTFISKNLRK